MKRIAILSVFAAAIVAGCASNQNGAGGSASAPDIVDTAVANGSFNTLVAAVKAAGLVETLKGEGPFTVFAPTDEAFSKLPAGTVDALLKPENKHKLVAVLTYHVVSGKVMAADAMKLSEAGTVQGQKLSIDASSGVKVGGANVTGADVVCSNGVIHVIDSVLIPKDIVEIAAADSRFSTLVAAVKAGELVDALRGDGPLTVFAPTNDAFAKLPKATLDSLLQPENKSKLQAVLTYHVVAGAVMAADVVKLKEAATLQGESLKITVRDGKVWVNDAQVVITDIPALNGVIHVIDTVVVPQGK